jgi:folylpolyglutamate synthase/dihydropteroate synthase
LAQKIIVTQSSHKNATPAVKIARKSRVNNIAATPTEALADWDKKSPLLITGSLYLVAQVMKLLDAHFKV